MKTISDKTICRKNNMVRNHLFMAITVGVTLLYSCSKSDVLKTEEPPQDNNTELSYLEYVSLLDDYNLPDGIVIKLLQSFHNGVNEDAASDDTTIAGDVSLQIIEKKEIPLGLSKTVSRSVGNQVSGLVPIYKIQMSYGDKCGYALVSGDARSAGVIAYIPDTASASSANTYNKEIADAMLELSVQTRLKRIEHFNEIKDLLISSAKAKIENGATTRSDKTDDGDFLLHEKWGMKLERSTDLHELTKTHWHQGYPYNCKLPQDCPENPDGRYAAGSGVVAIAQILAYYEPNLAIFGNKVDWKLLKKTETINSNADKKVKDLVGNLMRWIGEKTNAKYDCEKGTSTKANAIVDVLSLVNMKCGAATDWNWNVIYNSIKQGQLVHAAMHTDTGAGHAWVIDGYIVESYSNDKINYVHNNFGWGVRFDGYYQYEDTVKFQGGSNNLVVLDKIYPNIVKK